MTKKTVKVDYCPYCGVDLGEGRTLHTHLRDSAECRRIGLERLEELSRERGRPVV